MVKNLKNIICFCMAVICIAVVMPTAHVNASQYLGVWTNIDSPSKVTLHWEKKKVTGYDIYRAKVGKKETVGKYARIASVSGKKVSYSTKVSYKQKYSYLVKGYKKKNGRKVYQYEGDTEAYVGVGDVVWDFYFPVDANVSTSSISLMFNVREGICPDGFEIYRKTAKTKYKKIKTLKNSKKENYINYKDKTVKARKTYTYRVRSYKVIYGKKVYSGYTKGVSLSAVNDEGKYTVKGIFEEKDPISITIAITSDKNNGVTKFDQLFYKTDYRYKKSKYDEEISVEVIPIKYSWNQKDWTALTENDNISLEAGKTLFITYSTKNKEIIPNDIENYQLAEIIDLHGKYNGFWSFIDLDLVAKTGIARTDAEVYH